MYRDYSPILVQLSEDVDSGLVVTPSATPHDGKYPLVSASAMFSYARWMGITLAAGYAGDIVAVAPPYSGLVMARIKCDIWAVRTGDAANITSGGYFTTHEGSGEIFTGIIMTPALNEAPEVGKVVKAMIFTGRFTYDRKSV